MEHAASSPGSDYFASTVSDRYRGIRLDQYLVQELAGISRSQIAALVKAGSVKVNECPVKAGYRLKAGDRINARLEVQQTGDAPRPQPVEFNVIHEDPYLIAIAKPPGLVVHPGSGNRDNTLINGLLHRFGELAEVGDAARPGIVHRLDKDTSGIMLIARNRAVHQTLVESFKNRTIDKRYLALVHGRTERGSGRIVAAIGRHPVHRQKMAVRQTGGRHAASNWRLAEIFARHSLLEVQIETGRTHQIRVHLAHEGFPVAGDRLYGPNRPHGLFARQMLHAWKLTFDHPVSKNSMTLEAPLPPDFSSVVAKLREQAC